MLNLIGIHLVVLTSPIGKEYAWVSRPAWAGFGGAGRSDMYFKQMLTDACRCCSYFIASRESNEAVVVDTAFDIQPYLDLADERGYTIRYVVDTHLHAAHLSGNRKLAEATGAEVCLHEGAAVEFPFRKLRDGEELSVGQL